MLQEKLISVIVPCYNIQDNIEKTVNSLRAQSYENLEIILVNDGSTDNTADVLDRIAEAGSRIKVIHKENGGVTRARLTGVKEASGDYVGFMDGDDIAEPEMYETLLRNALEYQADISHCGYKRVSDGKETLYHGSGVLIEQDTAKGINDLLSGKLVEPGLWNKLFKKDLFEGLEEKMDFSIRINEDLLMNFYLFEKSKLSVFEDVCLYNYIIRNDSASQSSQRPDKIMDPVKAAKAIFERCNSEPQLAPASAHLFAVKLIQVSTKSKKNREIYSQIHFARKTLLGLLPFYLRCNGINFNHKAKTLFAAILPDIYRIIHTIYKKKKKTE